MSRVLPPGDSIRKPACPIQVISISDFFSMTLLGVKKADLTGRREFYDRRSKYIPETDDGNRGDRVRCASPTRCPVLTPSTPARRRGQGLGTRERLRGESDLSTKKKPSREHERKKESR